MKLERIFITTIVFVCIFVSAYLLRQKEQDKQLNTVLQNTEQPPIWKDYLQILSMGYGFGYRSGTRKIGITIITTSGQNSLIPTSPDDDFLLKTFNELLKPAGSDFRVFADHIFRQAQLFQNTEYVLFENNNACQARFHHLNSSVCVSTRDAVAICMVLTQKRILPLFAHKDFFTKKYWEALFAVIA